MEVLCVIYARLVIALWSVCMDQKCQKTPYANFKNRWQPKYVRLPECKKYPRILRGKTTISRPRTLKSQSARLAGDESGAVSNHPPVFSANQDVEKLVKLDLKISGRVPRGSLGREQLVEVGKLFRVCCEQGYEQRYSDQTTKGPMSPENGTLVLEVGRPVVTQVPATLKYTAFVIYR
ncbi:unnamed protein product [Nesidiocoris tenuis]|uniref:Uncharacterized protein n=1 Tax=Nesidiocoris tenuis TaxID=355587 RepID=A0A6H5HU76_9HEMI|nr:unnamed protein product [Nesidiocoris tenuis]